MKYLILPDESVANTVHEGWVLSDESSLGGSFYDYLDLGADPILGVRYWVDDSVVFDQHAVFKQFATDRRFKFHQKEGYVDMVFSVEHANALQTELLRVRTVQDLGGDAVVKNGSRFGILFCIGIPGQNAV